MVGIGETPLKSFGFACRQHQLAWGTILSVPLILLFPSPLPPPPHRAYSSIEIRLFVALVGGTRSQYIQRRMDRPLSGHTIPHIALCSNTLP